MNNVLNRVRDKFFAMVDSGMKNWDDRESRDILRSILMTTCDVAAITKPWEIQRKVSSSNKNGTLPYCFMHLFKMLKLYSYHNERAFFAMMDTRPKFCQHDNHY